MDKVVFVRKSNKVLFSTPWLKVEQVARDFVAVREKDGVVVIAYRLTANGSIEVLLREERNPLHPNMLTTISGRRDDSDGLDEADMSPDHPGKVWYMGTAKRELREEAGLHGNIDYQYLGKIIVGKGNTSIDSIIAADCTYAEQDKEIKTDGSRWEKLSKNFWVKWEDFINIVQETDRLESRFATASLKFIDHMRSLDLVKSEGTGKENSGKGKERPGHRYVKRAPDGKGGYIYTYPEDLDKKKRVKKPEEVKNKRTKKAEETKKFRVHKDDEKFLSNAVKGDDTVKIGSKTFSEFIAYIDKGIDDVYISLRGSRGDRQVKDLFDVEFATDRGQDKFFEIFNDVLSDPSLSDHTHAAKTLVARDTAELALKYAKVKFVNDLYSSNEFHENFSNALNSYLVDSPNLLFSKIKEGKDLGIVALARRNFTATSLFAIMAEFVDDCFSFSKANYSSSSGVSSPSWKPSTRAQEFLSEAFQQQISQLVAKRDRMYEKVSIAFAAALDSSLKDKLPYSVEGFSVSNGIANEYLSFAYRFLNDSANKEDIRIKTKWTIQKKGLYDNAIRKVASHSGKLMDYFKSSYNKDMSFEVKDTWIKAFENGSSLSHIYSVDSSSPALLTVDAVATSEVALAYIDEYGLNNYHSDISFFSGVALDYIASRAKDRYTTYFDDREATIKYNSTVIDDIVSGKQALGPKSNHFNIKRGDDLKGAFWASASTLAMCDSRSHVQNKIDSFIRMWSVASHNSVCVSAIEAFNGFNKDSFVNFHLAANRVATVRNADVQEGLKATVQAVKAASAKSLMESNIVTDGDKVKLYRGSDSNAVVDSAVCSWTDDENVAKGFGSNVISKLIPIDSVIAWHGLENTSWAFPSEQEFIIYTPGAK